jgi:hypothetical protein
VAAVPAVCAARGRPCRSLLFFYPGRGHGRDFRKFLAVSHKPPRERRTEPVGIFPWVALIGPRKLKILASDSFTLARKLGEH